MHGANQKLEEGHQLLLDFHKIQKVAQGEAVLPVVLQDVHTKEVLLIAYANQRALEESLKTSQVVLWSTSRQELWKKGASSGQKFQLVEIRVNCEQNSLLYLVSPLAEGACHTKEKGRFRKSCYYRRIQTNAQGQKYLEKV